MTEYKLSMEIIDLSKANNWDLAKHEWFLDHVYMIPKRDEPEICLCGHYPIREVCIIKNKENGNTTIVGNCCVTKFIGINSNKLIDAIKRVKKDHRNSFNTDCIELALKKFLINKWEYGFYISIWRKKKLSKKQLDRKVIINEKILEGI